MYVYIAAVFWPAGYHTAPLHRRRRALLFQFFFALQRSAKVGDKIPVSPFYECRRVMIKLALTAEQW